MGAPSPSEMTSTRGQILLLLCAADRTVAELAEAIGISRNAIRLHLTELEREGLVEYQRLRRGVGKPAHLYRLTTGGERSLSRAYLPLLDGLLHVLASRVEESEMEGLLREAGNRIAERWRRPQGGPMERVNAAVGLLEELGGAVEVETHERSRVLCGWCCPVAALTPDYPKICTAVEAMLAAFTGLSVREHCNRSERPHCRFDVFLEGEGS